MKIGQYTVTEGKWRFRYLIHKIMKKTADVSSHTSLDYGGWTGTREYRYPLDLLKQQIEGAEYLPFR